ncbi:MAG: tetratricopeptide repeat protein [Pirellulaceae bacterium]
MNRQASKQINSPATAPQSDDPQGTESLAAREPLVRGRVVTCALFMLMLAGGYYAGRFARDVHLTRGAGSAPSEGAEEAQVAGESASIAPLAMLDPDAPLPTTAEALYEETLRGVEGLVQLFPDNPDALEMKARVQVWLGNSAQAEAIWQQCLQLNPQYIHAYIGMASAAAKRAEHEKSLELAQHVLTLDADNFQARAILADALLQLGRASEVPGVLEEHLSKDPRSRGYYLLGQAYAQTGNSEKARDNYEAAVRIFPDYTEVYNGLAMAYQRLGETDKAKQAMEKFQQLGRAVEQDPTRFRESAATDLAVLLRDAATLYTDAGRILYVADRAREAEQFWLRAAALDHSNVPCRQSLAWACRNAGRQGENIVWLKQLAELEPANVSYWIEIGRIYEDLLLLPAAEQAFREACQVAPESDTGYAALADLLLRFRQNLPETVDLARKAIQYQPSAGNYAMLAAACRANQDLVGARSAIEQALALAPLNNAYRAVRDALQADQQP